MKHISKQAPVSQMRNKCNFSDMKKKILAINMYDNDN